MTFGVGLSLFLLALLCIGLFVGWLDHLDTVRTQENAVQKASSIEYEVKYNAKIKKYYINMVGNNSRSCLLYNNFGRVKYYPSATIATVEMEKLKGNFV